MVCVISIESPLGGGKGFFLKYLRQYKTLKGKELHVSLQDDAISHVMDMNNDAKRWSLFTELDFLLKHVLCIMEKCSAPRDSIVILEGSPQTDRCCYFNVSASDESERELYDEWYSIIAKHWKVDMHVMLKSSIHSHFDRVMGNSKKEQAFVTLGYLSHKLKLYDKVLHGSPQIVCEHNFEDNEPVLQVMKEKLEFLISDFLLKQNKR